MTNPEQREKIARALCLSCGDEPDREGPWAEWWQESTYARDADAVIIALDPTPEGAKKTYPTDAELDDAVRHAFGERFVDTPRPAPDVENLIARLGVAHYYLAPSDVAMARKLLAATLARSSGS